MQNAHEGDICLTGERAAYFEYKLNKSKEKHKYKHENKYNTNTNTTTDTNAKNSKKHIMHKKMIFAVREK